MVIDPSIGMLPVSCEQLLSLAGLLLLEPEKIGYMGVPGCGGGGKHFWEEQKISVCVCTKL